MTALFRITRGKGFHIPLPNGYTISVQFGTSDHGSNKFSEGGEIAAGQRGAAEVETAFWGPDGELLVWPEAPADTVQAWVDAEAFVKLFEYVRNLPAQTTEESE